MADATAWLGAWATEDVGSRIAVACLLLVVSGYLFLWVSVLADDYLSVSLGDLSKALGIPASVSAATFVAFGSSAPELVISAVGAASDNTELTIPTLLASALIAFGLIPAACALYAEETLIFEDPGSLFRDAFSFAVPLGLVAWYSTKPTTNIWQAAVLLVCYPIYVCATYSLSHAPEEEEEEEEGSYGTMDSDDDLSRRRKGLFVFPTASLLENKGEKTEDESSEKEEKKGTVLYYLEWPIRNVCEFTIVGGPWQRFLTTLAYVAALSYVAVYVAQLFADIVGLSQATAGMTVLAFGAQVPDLIAAVELAKNGHADSGVSQAVGSQVINLTLGLGLPYLFFILTKHQKVKTDNNDTIVNLSVLVALMILVYMAIFASTVTRKRRRSNTALLIDNKGNAKANLTRNHGYLFLAAFILVYGLGITSAELRFPRSYPF